MDPRIPRTLPREMPERSRSEARDLRHLWYKARQNATSSWTAEAALGNGETVQEYLTWSGDSAVSLRRSIRAARECARGIRDQLSLDIWEEVNELYHWLGRDATRLLYRDNRE